MFSEALSGYISAGFSGTNIESPRNTRVVSALTRRWASLSPGVDCLFRGPLSLLPRCSGLCAVGTDEDEGEEGGVGSRDGFLFIPELLFVIIIESVLI